MKQGTTYYHVFIGTKAQYIKTAPLLRLLQEQNIKYNLIDSGQHAAFAPDLRRELGVKEPDVVLRSPGNIKTVAEAGFWFLRYILFALFRPRFVRREIFKNKPGICIIHGDTPSTLLALVSAFVSKPNTKHKFNSFLDSPIGKAYKLSIKNNYRFYSFGDAMLIS